MSFLELVKKRRSCRRYSPMPVSREIIERCLDAARLAPSACNSQPWRFIVVQDPALKEKLAQRAFSGIYQMNAFAQDAPVLIVVLRERSKVVTELGGILRDVKFNLIDCGIACEHFILQAAEEGLETCWIGWFHERSVKRILDISSREKVDIIISLGYAQEATDESPVKNRKSLHEVSEFR